MRADEIPVKRRVIRCNLLLIYLIIQKCVTQICIIKKSYYFLHPELETINEKVECDSTFFYVFFWRLRNFL